MGGPSGLASLHLKQGRRHEPRKVVPRCFQHGALSGRRWKSRSASSTQRGIGLEIPAEDVRVVRFVSSERERKGIRR